MVNKKQGNLKRNYKEFAVEIIDLMEVVRAKSIVCCVASSKMLGYNFSQVLLKLRRNCCQSSFCIHFLPNRGS